MEIYNKYDHLIVKMLNSFYIPEYYREDMTQDIKFKICRAVEKLHNERRTKEITYIHNLVRNHIINFTQRNKHYNYNGNCTFIDHLVGDDNKQFGLLPDSQDIERDIMTNELVNFVYNNIYKLADLNRDLVIDKYIKSMTINALVSKYKLNKNVIRNTLNASMSILKRLMKEKVGKYV